MFVGRKKELLILEEKYNSKKSELVIVYGRRRIGKSELINHFLIEKKAYSFEGLEKINTEGQISHFKNQLVKQDTNPLLKNAIFKDWNEIFDYTTELISNSNKKSIIFFDEFQWMCGGKQKLVSLLKYYWDNHWKHSNCMLILCGSISSFMVKKVINSKALYGRASLEIKLKELSPSETYHLLGGKRSHSEALKYMLILGGVPKYLEEINRSRSLPQNIDNLFFRSNSLFKGEFNRIFYSQFKETTNYKEIVNQLSIAPMGLAAIGRKINFKSGGGLNSYLVNLENADFITSYIPFDKGSNSRLKLYKLTDAYLSFYFKYILPNSKTINQNETRNIFNSIVEQNWSPWLGFAFEKFCLKHREMLATKMGFSDKMLDAGPFFSRGDSGFQIDLVYKRSDKTITICEIKYRESKISTAVIPEFEKKLKLLKIPKGYSIEKALIAPEGASESLINSEYFDHIIVLKDIFS